MSDTPDSNRSDAHDRGQHFAMAPLIRLTLVGLYVALVLPLPLLAPPAQVSALTMAALAGLALVLAITSERVELNPEGIRVGHPPWCAWLLRRGWSLSWGSVGSLTPVATSQGGRVYYVRTPTKDAAYLLPQRVARFEQFLASFAEASGLDTSDIARISPPWTYQFLALLVVLLLGGEIWALIGRP